MGPMAVALRTERESDEQGGEREETIHARDLGKQVQINSAAILAFLKRITALENDPR